MKSGWMTLALVLLAGVLLAACAGVPERVHTGNRHYRGEEYDRALRAYQAAQVLDPDRPEAYFNAGSALVGMLEYERAVAALEQSLRSAEGGVAVSAYYNLGNIYFEMGRFQEAIRAYQQALLIDPGADDARYNLELALLRYVPATPTAIEQQTEMDEDRTDPDTTPTPEPGGMDGPTPTPPPIELDLTATPDSGEGDNGEDESTDPIPQSQGELTVEQAERLLDQIQQDQEALRDYFQEPAAPGEPLESW